MPPADSLVSLPGHPTSSHGKCASDTVNVKPAQGNQIQEFRVAALLDQKQSPIQSSIFLICLQITLKSKNHFYTQGTKVCKTILKIEEKLFLLEMNIGIL